MDNTELLKGIGISAGVVAVAILVGVGFIAYKNFYDLQQTKLNILKLQRELGLPEDNNIIEGYAKKLIPTK